MAVAVGDYREQLHDPFERFPAEIIQLIVDFLPLCDNWRLRIVNRRWNDHLTGVYALQAAARRWNTHAADQRASFESRPHPAPAEDARRMKSFLSGRPIAQATITPQKSPGPDLDIYNLQMSGKWLACRTNHQAGEPMHIELWDLVAGVRRTFATKPTHNLDFVLSSEMIAFTTHDEAFGRPEWRSEPLDNMLNTIDLGDFSLRATALSHHEPMQQSVRLAIHKSCVVVLRHRGVPPYDEYVEVFNRSDDTVSTFTWKAPVDDTMAYTFTVDADQQMVTFWSAFTRYAPGTSPGLDSMILRCMVAIEQYSFAGNVSGARKKQIRFHDDDCREMNMFGSWIMDLHSAGIPETWSAHINYWPVGQIKTVMQIDWGSASQHVDAYYRSQLGALVWKNMVFSLDENGDLHIGRNSSSSAFDTTSVSMTKLRTSCAKSDNGESGDEWPPELIAVNDSFLVICFDHSVRIFAFDALACQLTAASTEAQSERVETPSDTGEDQKLIWKSTKDCFLKDDAPSIVYSRTEPECPAGTALGLDPVLDSLKRMRNLLDQPL